MKQTFEIPDGCNLVTIEQQGNKIVTTFQPEFKDGDVLFVEENMTYLSTVFIFKKYIDNNRYDDYAAIVNGKLFYFEGYVIGFPRHATEQEKQQLFDALAKEGKQWNSEKKCIEDLKPEFKEGDILVKKYRPEFFGGTEYIFILDNIDHDGLIHYKAQYSKRLKTITIGTGYGIGNVKDSVHLELRYATKSERKILFNAIAKECKQMKELLKQINP